MLTFEKQDRHLPVAPVAPVVALAPVAQQTPRPATGGLPPTAPGRRPSRARPIPSRRADCWEDAARAQLAGVGITFF